MRPGRGARSRRGSCGSSCGPSAPGGTSLGTRPDHERGVGVAEIVKVELANPESGVGGLGRTAAAEVVGVTDSSRPGMGRSSPSGRWVCRARSCLSQDMLALDERSTVRRLALVLSGTSSPWYMPFRRSRASHAFQVIPGLRAEELPFSKAGQGSEAHQVAVGVGVVRARSLPASQRGTAALAALCLVA